MKPKTEGPPDQSASSPGLDRQLTASSHSRKSDYRPVRLLIAIPVLFGLWLAITSVNEVIPELVIYNGKRVLELCLISVTLSFLLISGQVRQKLEVILRATPSWVRVSLLIFFGLGLSSALLTPNPAYPLLDVAMLFLLILTAVTLASFRLVVGVNFDRSVLFLLALMCFGVFFQELIGMFVKVSVGQPYSYRETLFHFLHPRFYNQVQTWVIPLLALLPFVFIKTRWVGLLSVFLLGTQWYIILITGARGSTISLVLAMFTIGILLPTLRKHWIKLHAMGLVVGIVFYYSVFAFLGSVQPDKSGFVSESVGRPMLHTTGRTDLWKHALDDAIQNPFLGAGPMRYACEVDHYLAGSPHNFPLQIMGEWGIPAFLILGMLFSWLVYSWMKATRSIKRESLYKQALVACISISCVAAVIHVCVSGLLKTPASQVIGMLVAGWLLGILFDKGNRSFAATTAGGYRALFLSLVGVIVSISVLVFATAEIEKMPFRTAYAQDYGPITPRFWHDGRFCEYSF